ncbi:MAG: HNH endonuclease, partial [Nocardioides sp.]
MNPVAPAEPATAADLVLAAAGRALDAVVAAEAEQFRLAVAWAELHPGEAVDPRVPWEERELAIAGAGAPTVAEFAIADYALTAGMSTDAGRRFVGDAVETCHRLPRLWARVEAGEVRVWKARRVAQATRSLSPEAAAYVDRRLAHAAHSCSFAQIERTVERARAEIDPDSVEDDRLDAAEAQHLTVHTEAVTTNGLVPVEGLLDLPTALALDAVLRAGAHDLLPEHPELTLDQRRALAVGGLVRAASGAADIDLVIHAHLRESAPDGLVDVDNTRSVVTTEELLEWCRSHGVRVTVRPVLDLDAELTTTGYHPSAAQHEQAVQRHRTCVFPSCTRPSRGCDLDHIVPWEKGGATTSANLAPLCRGHHRLKTHSRWTYRRTGPATFTWT